MLIVNPNKRISIKEVCEHPYFKEEWSSMKNIFSINLIIYKYL